MERSGSKPAPAAVAARGDFGLRSVVAAVAITALPLMRRNSRRASFFDFIVYLRSRKFAFPSRSRECSATAWCDDDDVPRFIGEVAEARRGEIRDGVRAQHVLGRG